MAQDKIQARVEVVAKDEDGTRSEESARPGDGTRPEEEVPSVTVQTHEAAADKPVVRVASATGEPGVASGAQAPFDAAAASGQPGGAQSTPAGPEGILSRIGAWLSETFPHSRNAVVGGVVGLAVAVLLFSVGLLKTLLIVVLVTVGVAVGQYFDGDPKIARIIQELMRRQ